MKSFIRTVGAVLSAFFGVRGHKNANEDFSTFRPQHVIITGILVTAVFVMVLIVIVNIIVT